MPGWEMMLAFLGTGFVFAVMPGPAMLYTAAQTLARGRRAGLMAVAGINLGGMVHVAAAAAGLSALFLAVPEVYAAVKLAGAAYLVWLGISMFRNPERRAVAVPQKTARRAFFESVTVEVLNPKTVLFFVSLLPQFVDPGAAWPVWAQFLVLGLIVNTMFGLADLVCVVFAGKVSERLRRSSASERIARAVGGTILVGLGARLAIDR